MKKVVAVTLFLNLLITLTTGSLLDSAAAYPSVYLPNITIKSDGSIEPETEYIAQKGSTYTLTRNISGKYALAIQCSNIVLDGSGYTVNGSSVYGAYSNIGLSLESARNVTVKNISIIRFLGYAGILCSNCSECLFYNTNTTWIVDLSDSHFVTISHCDISETLGLGVNNQVTESIIKALKLDNSSFVTKNNITDVIMSKGCHSNTVFSNNLLGQRNSITSIEENFWDNGSMGNYWSDYKTKYPTATEINNTGIGNTPYVINVGNFDNYPIITPLVLQSLPISTSTLEPEPESSPDLLPVIIIAVVFAVLITAIVQLIYLKCITKKKD